jgi:hypothetical protein
MPFTKLFVAPVIAMLENVNVTFGASAAVAPKTNIRTTINRRSTTLQFFMACSSLKNRCGKTRAPQSLIPAP